MILAAAALGATSACASCGDALKPLLGFSLESVAGHESRRATGMKMEGREHVASFCADHRGQYVCKR